jgi:tripartite-type tricarboxylate transporter receptor subunit TctC
VGRPIESYGITIGKEAKMKRGRLYWIVCGLNFLFFLCGVQAQEKYPNRTIELVVPFAPGGTGDLTARIYTETLAQTLKNPVAINNRPGGGGVTGILYVTRAKKDGYTLLNAGTPQMCIVPIITPEATFNTLRDFIPLGSIGYVPSVFVVRPDSPITSFRGLVEYARKNPGQLRNAVGGFGTASYCNLQILVARNNLNINTIPFASGGETIAALLGGHVDMTSSGFMTLGAHIKAGRLRPLATVSKDRYPDFPNIPTTAEEGYPYINFCDWQGCFAPVGIPQYAQDVLVKAVEKVFKDAQVGTRAKALFLTPSYKSPQEFRKFIESENLTWGKVYKDAGLSVR